MPKSDSEEVKKLCIVSADFCPKSGTVFHQLPPREFMKLARSAGVDTTSPIVFFYQDVGGAWVEFSFNEQLELIARLYRDREKAERYPEQRNVSMNGEGLLRF